jgi:hypothetical protein
MASSMRSGTIEEIVDTLISRPLINRGAVIDQTPWSKAAYERARQAILLLLSTFVADVGPRAGGESLLSASRGLPGSMYGAVFESFPGAGPGAQTLAA